MAWVTRLPIWIGDLAAVTTALHIGTPEAKMKVPSDMITFGDINSAASTNGGDFPFSKS